MFLDLRSCASGESAALRRLAAARSPAEDDGGAGAGAAGEAATKPRTSGTEPCGVDGEDDDDVPLAAVAERSSASSDRSPQGVRGGVGVQLASSMVRARVPGGKLAPFFLLLVRRGGAERKKIKSSSEKVKG